MTDEPRSAPTSDGDIPSSAGESTGLLEQLAVSSLLAEAEDLTRGVRYLSVATGDPETDDELARINALTAAAWTAAPDAETTSIRGGSDYLTIRVEGPAADSFIEVLATLAERLDPGFWRINRSPHAF
ncbi:hypothetical protein [Mycobacterium sp. NPDC006124]|uniref:hypothetical protein n=1 Tax=Mycobacterium sp. NPDC006124 TaxID=3156729 RepID=UPI0033A21FAF